MKSEYLANAEWALEVLLRGSVNERQDLRDRLEFEEDSKIDKAALSAMILEQLNGDFQESAIPPNPEDHPKRWTRHWLLTILGRLGSQDPKATAMLVQIATKRSSSKSGTDACYWAMEALIKMNPDNLPEIAQTVYDINFAESPNTAPAQQNASS
ncbi:MAG TPA: hypothetical protein VHS96_13595, partial [Bacteroidia bacterium]|nr:hypothetical protein [Bacteroidia bacterium]